MEETARLTNNLEGCARLGIRPFSVNIRLIVEKVGVLELWWVGALAPVGVHCADRVHKP